MRLADLDMSVVQHLLCVSAREGLRPFTDSSQAETEQRAQVNSNLILELTTSVFVSVRAIKTQQIKSLENKKPVRVIYQNTHQTILNMQKSNHFISHLLITIAS